MDLGFMVVLVLVGVAIGSFITKALFPRTVVREVEVEVVRVERANVSGIVVDIVSLLKQGYKPAAHRGGSVSFFLPSEGKVFHLTRKGEWKDHSATYNWLTYSAKKEEEPPY